MCTIITGCIPKGISLNAVNAIARKELGFPFQVCANDFVQKQLLKDECYIAKASHECDCDTLLGIYPRRKQMSWSDELIEEFLADKKQVNEHANLKKWQGFILKLLDTTKMKQFGILLHWYSHGVHNEEIAITKRITVPKSRFSAQTLLEMEEDTLYCIMA